MDTNQHRSTDDALAEQIAKLESELAQIKSGIDAMMREGAKKTDLIDARSDIYVSVKNSQFTILLFILFLMILSHGIYLFSFV